MFGTYTAWFDMARGRSPSLPVQSPQRSCLQVAPKDAHSRIQGSRVESPAWVSHTEWMRSLPQPGRWPRQAQPLGVLRAWGLCWGVH